jgi:HSP20 family protein
MENNELETKETTLEEIKKTVEPDFDIFENNEEFLLKTDIPGVEEKNIELKFENDELILSGEVKKPDSTWKFLSKGYRDLDYKRVFKLPAGLNINKINAAYKNGVLEIKIPKSVSFKARKIKIN